MRPTNAFGSFFGSCYGQSIAELKYRIHHREAPTTAHTLKAPAPLNVQNVDALEVHKFSATVLDEDCEEDQPLSAVLGLKNAHYLNELRIRFKDCKIPDRYLRDVGKYLREGAQSLRHVSLNFSNCRRETDKSSLYYVFAGLRRTNIEKLGLNLNGSEFILQFEGEEETVNVGRSLKAAKIAGANRPQKNELLDDLAQTLKWLPTVKDFTLEISDNKFTAKSFNTFFSALRFLPKLEKFNLIMGDSEVAGGNEGVFEDACDKMRVLTSLKELKFWAYSNNGFNNKTFNSLMAAVSHMEKLEKLNILAIDTPCTIGIFDVFPDFVKELKNIRQIEIDTSFEDISEEGFRQVAERLENSGIPEVRLHMADGWKATITSRVGHFQAR